jgi:hypothetical protein
MHYWLGFLIPAVALLHAMLPMSAGNPSRFNQTGLLLATFALFAMLWQLGLGLKLREAGTPDRKTTRHFHLWTMTLIVALVVAHIFLNRA